MSRAQYALIFPRIVRSESKIRPMSRLKTTNGKTERAGCLSLETPRLKSLAVEDDLKRTEEVKRTEEGGKEGTKHRFQKVYGRCHLH